MTVVPPGLGCETSIKALDEAFVLPTVLAQRWLTSGLSLGAIRG